jgi:hypothetical protein
MLKTPTARSGTSPKCDMRIMVDKFMFTVGFGGGRRGLVRVARAVFDDRRECRDMDGLSHSLLSESFDGGA